MKTRTVVNVLVRASVPNDRDPAFRPGTGFGSSGSRPASPASKVTMQGCLERTQAATSTPGATGTAGTNASFILTKAERAGAPAAPVTPPSRSGIECKRRVTYRLDADASKLTPDVHQRVEISGTLSARGPSAERSCVCFGWNAEGGPGEDAGGELHEVDGSLHLVIGSSGYRVVG